MSAIYPDEGDPRKLAELLRQNINPAFAYHIGTESHERRICAEAIEAQAARIADLERQLAHRSAELTGAFHQLAAVVHQRDELTTKHQVACDTIERQRTDIDTIRGYLDGMKKSCERTAQQRDELLAALEMARNGIAWYIENAPEANGCDDEALQQIDAAIAKVQK